MSLKKHLFVPVKTYSLPDGAVDPTGNPDFPDFSWPPPQASASIEIPYIFFKTPNAGVVRLSDVDFKLSSVLFKSGYVEKSYYSVPNGFAIVTRIEQINNDGSPKPVPERWLTKIPPLKKFSLELYLYSLFTSNVGYYRVFVFIVTSSPFKQANTTMSREEAIDWLSHGNNKLPLALSKKEYSMNYTCTCLVYEFEQREFKENGKLLLPGKLTGLSHLNSVGIWGFVQLELMGRSLER